MSVKQTSKTREYIMKCVYSGVLIALGILLPQAFHIFGQNAGMIFLPIQIPIFMAGILLGPYYGLIVGLIVPVLSAMLTGMPPVPKLYFMLFELGTYGLMTGFMSKRCNIYLNLAVSMAAGRIVYGLSLVGGIYLLQMQAPFMNTAAFVSGITSGIPGVIIQFAVIPILYLVLKKGGFTFAK